MSIYRIESVVTINVYIMMLQIEVDQILLHPADYKISNNQTIILQEEIVQIFCTINHSHPSLINNKKR